VLQSLSADILVAVAVAAAGGIVVLRGAKLLLATAGAAELCAVG